MLQNKFEMPLDLAVKPSNIFSLYLYGIFSLSVVSVFISTSLPISLRLLLFVILVFVAMVTVKKSKLIKVTSLKLKNTDEWELELNSNERFDVELSGECIVTYFLIWLNFTKHNSLGRKKSFHLLLLSDSADKDLLRQLRVRLRFLKGTEEVPESL